LVSSKMGHLPCQMVLPPPPRDVRCPLTPAIHALGPSFFLPCVAGFCSASFTGPQHSPIIFFFSTAQIPFRVPPSRNLLRAFKTHPGRRGSGGSSFFPASLLVGDAARFPLVFLIYAGSRSGFLDPRHPSVLPSSFTRISVKAPEFLLDVKHSPALQVKRFSSPPSNFARALGSIFSTPPCGVSSGDHPPLPRDSSLPSEQRRSLYSRRCAPLPSGLRQFCGSRLVAWWDALALD